MSNNLPSMKRVTQRTDTHSELKILLSTLKKKDHLQEFFTNNTPANIPEKVTKALSERMTPGVWSENHNDDHITDPDNTIFYYLYFSTKHAEATMNVHLCVYVSNAPEIAEDKLEFLEPLRKQLTEAGYPTALVRISEFTQTPSDYDLVLPEDMRPPMETSQIVATTNSEGIIHREREPIPEFDDYFAEDRLMGK